MKSTALRVNFQKLRSVQASDERHSVGILLFDCKSAVIGAFNSDVGHVHDSVATFACCFGQAAGRSYIEIVDSRPPLHTLSKCIVA